MRQTIIYSRKQWAGMNLTAARVSSLAMGVWNGETEGSQFHDVEVSQDYQGINEAAHVAREHSQECVMLILEWNAGARRNAWAQLSPAMPDSMALAMVAPMASATVIPCMEGFSRVLCIGRENPGECSGEPWQVWPVYALLVSADGSTGPVL